jgi:hypothetical protein
MSEITETAEGFTIVSQSNYHIYDQHITTSADE